MLQLSADSSDSGHQYSSPSHPAFGGDNGGRHYGAAPTIPSHDDYGQISFDETHSGAQDSNQGLHEIDFI